jgi:hypothetical protein
VGVRGPRRTTLIHCAFSCKDYWHRGRVANRDCAQFLAQCPLKTRQMERPNCLACKEINAPASRISNLDHLLFKQVLAPTYNSFIYNKLILKCLIKRRGFPSIDRLIFVSISLRLKGLVRPERFELPTPCFVGKCSIQLSYGRRQTRKANRASAMQTFILHLCPSSVNAPLAPTCEADDGFRNRTWRIIFHPAGPCPLPPLPLYLAQPVWPPEGGSEQGLGTADFHPRAALCRHGAK